MAPDFAFIQTSPGRLFVGWGPFDQLPLRRPGRPAFFIADFFLTDPHPWRHPARWEEMSVEEFAAQLAAGERTPSIAWDAAPDDQFRALFDSAQEAMARGDFRKIVPVVFESGRAIDREGLARSIVQHLGSLAPHLWAYGFSYRHHGVIGATPEVLFRSEGRGYRTMALAGTRPIDRASELLDDAKEQREHRHVVDDIARRLAPFGNLEIGPVDVLRLPAIAHLATPIYFEEFGGDRMSFSDMVRRLHPTAALGVFPRTEAGERWLRDADRGVERKTFGAPFGVELEDHSSIALVAIRNLEWTSDRVRIGSGAGLLPESRIDRELEELRQKRAQVKGLLGLDSLAPAAERS